MLKVIQVMKSNYILVFMVMISLLTLSCSNQKFASQNTALEAPMSSLNSYEDTSLESIANLSAQTYSSSGLCEIKTVSAVGIGDGCTTSYSGVDFSYIPEIGAFKGTFTGACQKHDRCFSTLGSSTDECNDDFRNDLMDACGKYSWFFRPIERSTCEHAARMYHAGVKAYAARYNPVPAMQTQALSLSRQLQARVENDECGSSPERAGLYSDRLISKIKTRFLQVAGREPTFYEFLQVVNSSNDIVQAPNSWTGLLENSARAALYSSPPALKVILSGGYLKVDPVIPGVNYGWKIDGYGIVIGTSVYVGGGNPKYDITRSIQGAVKAWTDSGEKNILPIDTKIRIQGECASRPGQMCR